VFRSIFTLYVPFSSFLAKVLTKEKRIVHSRAQSGNKEEEKTAAKKNWTGGDNEIEPVSKEVTAFAVQSI
jgi:hypothetical protein